MTAPPSAPYTPLAADATFHAHRLDLELDQLLLIETEPGFYRAASFLDDRILTPQTKGRWSPLGRVAQAMQHAPPPLPLHFIFHAGHVGSTLVSRLLDETGTVLPLREPLPLRALAEAQDAALDQARLDGLIALHLKLWRRGFPGARAVVLKATSSAARLAPRLLGAASDARALYLHLAAEPYLATLLAGENTPVDLRGMGQERRARLIAHLGAEIAPLTDLTLGELAAMTWIAERLAQTRLVDAQPERTLALDFDILLRDVPAALAAIIAHFGLDTPPAYLDTIGASPVLSRYSKATEQPYSPALRQAVLKEARARCVDELRAGLAWLDRLAAAHPAAAALL